ncbi:hypothetical protein Tsubulata_051340 [Turnera subulata]|uniref:DNA-directed RNA polymerase n=1 Tax=Turnera subulata TaxID=218843 RepID=A0A9Q0FSR0_9ROSI|nr:hypothetical protein Tsubulata_051340 [Turnera subulata]
MEDTSQLNISEGEIVGIAFGLASHKEICTASVSDCSISQSSQLSNPFLGLPLEFGKCKSCGTSELRKCEGHFGYIELPIPIYHPSHVIELKRMLMLLCLKCLKLKKTKIQLTSNGVAQRFLSCCEVNGVDLAEIDGGEISITNLLSCNGPDFVGHLRFIPERDNGAARSPGLRASPEANARLKCVYIPIVEMLAGYKKGHNAQFLRRCCLRVKCYIEADAGFNPTPSKVPEPCPAGSQLENVVFEVVDSQGIVDDSFHDDEKTGQSHLLTLKSDLINTESRHCFRHGSCTIPAIAIPPNEGAFCFTVSHSRYPELESRINVSVIQTPKSVKTEIRSPYSEGKVLLLQDSLVLNHAGDLTPFIDKDLQVLKKYAEEIGSLELNLKDLEGRKVELLQNIDELQDSLEPYHVLNGLEIMPGREEVVLQIEKRNCAAVANLFGLLHVWEKDLMDPLIGSVALLGTVCDNKLSRLSLLTFPSCSTDLCVNVVYI